MNETILGPKLIAIKTEIHKSKMNYKRIARLIHEKDDWLGIKFVKREKPDGGQDMIYFHSTKQFGFTTDWISDDDTMKIQTEIRKLKILELEFKL